MSKWFVKKCSQPSKTIVDFYGVSKPLAYSLYHRGIRNRDTIKAYTRPFDYVFEDIKRLRDLNKALEIVSNSIKRNENICIYGDYDADGVMSTSIMYKGLKSLGANVSYFVPNRVEDGYGLNERAVNNIIDRGIDLIIACDNGISASKQIELAVSRGAKVVVLDHHEPPFTEENGVRLEIIPPANAVVDAKISDCGYHFTQMCAAGLCYRFICELFDFMNEKLDNKDELLELAAVATVCDVVDLMEDNRAIVFQGISHMNKGSANLGLATLIELKNIETITAYTLGFVIGPCINASGRLDSAQIAVELFVTNDQFKAKELAQKLIDYNEERKAITFEALERIVDRVESSSIINDKILVVYDEDTHESVAGIIAGRLRERYSRPAIVLTNGEDCVKGSGRSVENYDMFLGLCGVNAYIDKFGGHTMAAGLSLDKSNVDNLRKAINDNCTLTLEDMETIYRADAILDLEDITLESVDELSILAPFGKGNEKPIFGIKGVKAEDIRFVGKEGKISSFTITDEKHRVRAVDFDNFDFWKAVADSREEDITFSAMINVDINEYKEYRNPQIIIKDVRLD